MLLAVLVLGVWGWAGGLDASRAQSAQLPCPAGEPWVRPRRAGELGMGARGPGNTSPVTGTLWEGGAALSPANTPHLSLEMCRVLRGPPESPPPRRRSSPKAPAFLHPPGRSQPCPRSRSQLLSQRDVYTRVWSRHHAEILHGSSRGPREPGTLCGLPTYSGLGL